MPRDEQLRKNLARLSRARDRVENSLRQVQAMPRAEKPGKRNVNLSTRVNKAVVTNIGEPDTVKGASSRQSVRIRQNPRGTDEVSETTSVQLSSQGHT